MQRNFHTWTKEGRIGLLTSSRKPTQLLMAYMSKSNYTLKKESIPILVGTKKTML
jgi:hypothetical protein